MTMNLAAPGHDDADQCHGRRGNARCFASIAIRLLTGSPLADVMRSIMALAGKGFGQTAFAGYQLKIVARPQFCKFGRLGQRRHLAV
jgi:hypothetical protein